MTTTHFDFGNKYIYNWDNNENKFVAINNEKNIADFKSATQIFENLFCTDMEISIDSEAHEITYFLPDDYTAKKEFLNKLSIISKCLDALNINHNWGEFNLD
jgi:hypothetical protein